MSFQLQRRSAFDWGPTDAGWANPTRGMAVHYEGGDTGIAGWRHAQCIDHWQDTRRFHMNSRGWADIGYSFGCCPHYVLEGRGKDHVQAAQPGGNATWYSCTFMTGPGEQPHPNQVQHFRELRAWLMRDDVARAIRPHSSFVATGCPGDILRRMIRDGTLTRGELELALTDNDIRRIVDALNNKHDEYPYGVTVNYGGVKKRVSVNSVRANNETGIDDGVKAIRENLALTRKIAQRDGVDVDVVALAKELAPLVNAALTPDEIADSIDDDLAQRLADVLAARLTRESS